ncbi:MAG: hypothetical protein Q9180_004713 [Flavoplaca navasiana]
MHQPPSVRFVNYSAPDLINHHQAANPNTSMPIDWTTTSAPHAKRPKLSGFACFQSDVESSETDDLSVAGSPVPGQSWLAPVLRLPASPFTDTSEAEESSAVEEDYCRKRKRTYQSGRSCQARLAAPVPVYEVKQSTTTPGQQLALDWCTYTAKQDFERLLRNLLARVGGVGLSHQGTCVLCPQDLPDLKTTKIASAYQLPGRQSPEFTYQYSDYSTTMVRTIAWFRGQWPRPLVHLDDFIGDCPWLPMEATHLCHQNHCLVHVIAEDGVTKESRKTCATNACLARQAGQDLPGECSIHQPPCLLQHAALTTEEVYHIQLDIRSQATGLHLNIATEPCLHPFPTFESRLPLAWGLSQPALKVDPKVFVATIPLAERPCQPILGCRFCSIKPFRSMNGLWGHLIHKHPDVDTSERLEDIRRTAGLWAEYYQAKGRKGARICEKAVQAGQESFTWADVLAWKLRGSRGLQETD